MIKFGVKSFSACHPWNTGKLVVDFQINKITPIQSTKKDDAHN